MEALLKRRTVEAQATAEVYLFVAEFLQLVSDSHVFQVCVMFCAIASCLLSEVFCFCVFYFSCYISLVANNTITID